MTTTAETLAAMRAKHAAEIAALERALAVKESVTLALGLTADNWSPGHMHVHRADCFILYRAPDLAAAIEMAERMGPVSMVIFKDSSTSFFPLDSVTAKQQVALDADRASCDLVTPYIYEIDGITGQPETRRLVFYVDAGGYRVQVRVTVDSDPLTHRVHVPAQRDSRGFETRPARWDIVNRSGHFSDAIRWWTSQGHPNHFTLYSHSSGEA